MTTPQSAFDILRDQLTGWGIGSLAGAIAGYITDGIDANQALLQLRQTTEYKTRFAGNEIRRAKGFSVLSEGEYLSREDSLKAQFAKYELPTGFYDSPDDFAKAIGANLGVEEMGARLEARKAILTDGAATGVLAYAQQQYGLGTGDLLAYFIDPERSQGVLERIAAASQIGAAASRSGFGTVDKSEAERLAALGINANQATQGYSQAAGMNELTQDVGDQGISRDDLSQAIFEQNAPAQQRVARKQEERRAGFQGGGSFAQSKTGVAGLGSANT